MAITRRLLVQQGGDVTQVLKMDSVKRYIWNKSRDWQMMFPRDGAFTASLQSIKIGVEFNKESLDSIRLVGFLYDSNNGTIAKSGTVTFKISTVTTPDWTEQLVHTVSAAEISNGYFFVDVPTANLSPANLDGGDTIVIDAVITRLSEVRHERIFVNHLGVYDSIIRLQQKVNFLELTKLDE